MFTKREFVLTEDEYKKIEKWAKTHDCSAKYGTRPRSCCGGEITLEITPTTVGTFISAKCICGDKIKVRG